METLLILGSRYHTMMSTMLFIHPDGRTWLRLKRTPSIGGYDLFLIHDNSINDWTAPVNLDFAFSSADDDVLFITDEDKALAFFVSNRTTTMLGKLTVYKVKVEKKVFFPDFAIIRFVYC